MRNIELVYLFVRRRMEFVSLGGRVELPALSDTMRWADDLQWPAEVLIGSDDETEETGASWSSRDIKTLQIRFSFYSLLFFLHFSEMFQSVPFELISSELFLNNNCAWLCIQLGSDLLVLQPSAAAPLSIPLRPAVKTRLTSCWQRAESGQKQRKPWRWI